jgi:hypothetical protein
MNYSALFSMLIDPFTSDPFKLLYVAGAIVTAAIVWGPQGPLRRSLVGLSSAFDSGNALIIGGFTAVALATTHFGLGVYLIRGFGGHWAIGSSPIAVGTTALVALACTALPSAYVFWMAVIVPRWVRGLRELAISDFSGAKLRIVLVAHAPATIKIALGFVGFLV